MDDFQKPSIIENALSEMARISFPSPTICTGWVLVSEWSDGSSPWLMTLADTESPVWKHKGMLDHAKETWGIYDDIEVGEDDDE